MEQTLIDFAEDDNAGEAGFGVVWDRGVEEEYAYSFGYFFRT